MNAIEMCAVGKDYSHFRLVDIDLAVEEGSIMGFVGPNGAGKSTTLRILMGLVHQDRGQVSVLGHDLPGDAVTAKLDTGYVSEDMRLHPTETIGFHIELMRRIYPGWDEAYADALLARFHLRFEQKVKGLSHGERIKATLLLALARRPRLLLLDEPTTGLDPAARKEILDEMAEVLVDDGRTILFSSHNTQDIEQLCDRVTMIDQGKIIFSDDKEALLDRWRRVRVRTNQTLPCIEGLRVEQAGPITIGTVSNFSAALPAMLERQRCEVMDIEPMSLEEIFLANVEVN